MAARGFSRMIRERRNCDNKRRHQGQERCCDRSPAANRPEDQLDVTGSRTIETHTLQTTINGMDDPWGSIHQRFPTRIVSASHDQDACAVVLDSA